MKFLLIRHGQSANNALPETERVHDPPLTELGQQQAEQLSHVLAKLPLTRLIVSPFRRTLQTAWPTVCATQLPAEIWVEIHERGGCFRGFRAENIAGEGGMTRTEIASEFPGIVIPDTIDESGWWKSSDRESDASAEERVERAVLRIVEEFEGTDEFIAFFTHADFKSLFARRVQRGEAPQQFHSAHNTGISHCQLDKHGVLIDRYNVIDHLPDELHSW